MTSFNFCDQVLKFYPHFACSERLRKFPIKYGDLRICGRGVRKIDTVIIVAYDYIDAKDRESYDKMKL